MSTAWIHASPKAFGSTDFALLLGSKQIKLHTAACLELAPHATGAVEAIHRSVRESHYSISWKDEVPSYANFEDGLDRGLDLELALHEVSSLSLTALGVGSPSSDIEATTVVHRPGGQADTCRSYASCTGTKQTLFGTAAWTMPFCSSSSPPTLSTSLILFRGLARPCNSLASFQVSAEPLR